MQTKDIKIVKRLSSYKRNKILHDVLTKCNSVCADCNSVDDLQIDHITAISLGGTNELDNLQILCGNCNRKKGGAKSPGAPRVKSRIKNIRKEVWLPESVLDFFEEKAKEKKWSLKKFMEQSLISKYQSYREFNKKKNRL